MKVNIIGKGIIPLPEVGTLAPVYGVELCQRSLEKLLTHPHFTITQYGTNLRITRTNVAGFFRPATEIPVAKPVAVKKETYVKPEVKVEPTAIEVPPEMTPIEPVEEFVIEDTPEEPAIDEPKEEVAVDPAPEKFGNVAEEDIDVKTAETPNTKTAPYEKKNKKKNRR